MFGAVRDEIIIRNSAPISATLMLGQGGGHQDIRSCSGRGRNRSRGEGRKRAMANGVKFGRKRKLSDYQRAEAVKRRNAGETLASIAKSYGVDLSMISRL